MDLALLDDTLAAAGEPAVPRPPGVELDGARRDRLRADDRPARRRCAARLAEAVPFSSLESVREAHASDGTVKALFHTHDGRAGRGGADALPRRPALGLRLLAVGLPADLHVLRHRRR